MTIGLILTIIFFVLDYTGKVDWAWWQIALPMLIEIGIGFLIVIGWIVTAIVVTKN